jgi:hypothetical protein
MKRYFESFYNADPMDELSEAAAHQLGTYAVEDDPALRRYHRIISRQLDSIIYAGWDEPAVPLADLERLGATVRAEIHSTVQRLDHGGHQWRTWYLDPLCKVTKVLELEFATDGRRVRSTLRSPDGTLVAYTIYHYDRDGHLLELVTHAPDGTVLNTQDA